MGRKTRWGLALGAALVLSACGSVGGAGAPRSTAADVALADLALASLAKGDYAQAEIFVDRAMQAEAQDPYALLAAGLLYQNTNRPVEAVRVYKILVHLAPQDEATVGAWFHLERRPLTDIAQGNLEILAMLPATAAAMAEPVVPPRQMAAAAAAPANDGEGPRSLVPRSQAPAPAATASAPLVPPVGPVVAPTTRPFIDPASVTAVIGRFLTLNRLLADGLMTQEEYSVLDILFPFPWRGRSMVPGSPPWSQGTRTSAQARRIRHAPAPSSFPSPNETGFDPQPALGHSARMSLTSSLPTTLHATALEKGGVAILLRGPSGAGKSDLALRLLDRGFRLIADDRVVPHVEEAGLRVSAPSALAGLLEVRGVGIVSVPAVGGSVPLALVVDLVPGGPVERLPDPAWAVIENTPVPLVRCDPWELSAPHKVDLALALRREESPLSYLSHTPSY